ncbi:tetratricopeptide repeat protein [Flavobacterium sp.]|uniref:tetratricopeptide repeat protein n=1 Tax=Flavobacterium sp. TaxID=239 RepID=UPI0012260DA6|nr:tetratricopeptide repeat protein [Flavobacterium sp.]RZJ72402.1 MAG: tetratricopeptide repeat protein [Flavobacterium sp.]
MKQLLTYSLILFGLSSVFAQDKPKEEKDRSLPKGNEAFAEKKYADAEADYRISQSKFAKKAAASYNLGNSIYEQKHEIEAGYAYGNAIKNATTRDEKHRAYHNMGNVLMGMKDYQGAVNAYRDALINKPSDDETRYNYALAKKMLKENPPKPNDKDKDKKGNDKEDKKNGGNDKNQKQNQKDKQDQDKGSGKDKQDQNKGGEGNKPQEGPKPTPGSGISGKRVENLLDAVNYEEKKVQDKMKEKQEKGRPVKTEKDW